MARSLLHHLDSAFQLAFLIHRDKAVALDITLEAFGRVDVLATRQDKRRYYQLMGRWLGSRQRRHRHRVSRSEAQLLQRILLTVSEPHERRQEASNERLDQDLLAIRYIAFLVRRTLRRNAFHVAVGLGRLLYDYSTRETIDLYDLVLQDAERYRGSDYFRARKKILLEEMHERFGPLLTLDRGRRGELRFRPRAFEPSMIQFVHHTLGPLTPWETTCLIPKTFDPTRDSLEGLRFRGSLPDEEHPIEMHRIHALIHPGCFERLAGALGLAPPSERLALPLFNLGEADRQPPNGSDDGDGPKGGGPPRLDDVDRRRVLDELERRKELRRRIQAGLLRVRVDGADLDLWDIHSTPRFESNLEHDVELVEVLTHSTDDGVIGEEIILAACLVPWGETEETVQVPLDGGGTLQFSFVGNPNDTVDEGSSMVVDYRGPWHGFLAPRWLPGPIPTWAATGAALLVCLGMLGGGLLLDRPQQITDRPVVRGSGQAAVTLGNVERVFVDPWGNSPDAREFRTRLRDHIDAIPGLTAVAERPSADAVLMPGAQDPSMTRLVNARGEVLWRHRLRGSADERAERLAQELHTAIQRTQAQSP